MQTQLENHCRFSNRNIITKLVLEHQYLFRGIQTKGDVKKYY